MPDTNITVRADEEVKEQFERLAQESGIGKKDFLRTLVDTYELNQTKKSVPMLENDIDELQKLTSRINNIFINTGERLRLWEEQQLQDNRQEVESKESIIELLQRQVDSLKEDKSHDDERINTLIDAKESAESKATVMDEKNRQLQAINAKNDALIQSYSEMIEQLKSDIQGLRPIAEMYDGLMSENDRLKRSLEATNKEVQDLKEAITQKETEFTHILKKEVEQTAMTLTLEKDRAIVDLKTEYQAKLAEVQARHSEKVSELLRQREIDIGKRQFKRQTGTKNGAIENNDSGQ